MKRIRQGCSLDASASCTIFRDLILLCCGGVTDLLITFFSYLFFVKMRLKSAKVASCSAFPPLVFLFDLSALVPVLWPCSTERRTKVMIKLECSGRKRYQEEEMRNQRPLIQRLLKTQPGST